MHLEWSRPLGVVLVLVAVITPPAIALDGDPQTQKALREAMEALEDCDMAIAQWEKALQLDPTRAEAHSNLGACYMRKGVRFRRTARFHLEHASRLEAGEREWVVWYNLAALYSLNGELEEAASAFEAPFRLEIREADRMVEPSQADPDLEAFRAAGTYCEILVRYDYRISLCPQ